MRIHRGAEGPVPDRPAAAPADVAAQAADRGQSSAAGPAHAPDASGYGIVTSISEEARVAADRARSGWRPNIRYIFEQGLAFAHQAVDRRRLARAVRKQVEDEAVSQANRFAAMDGESAHAAAMRAGERLRQVKPDLVA